jgi:osmotically inducible lipoprotein OsmB
VVGDALVGGPVGTVGGAAAGAYLGNEASKRY